MTSDSKPEILIVDGGLAGLAAASFLRQKHNVDAQCPPVCCAMILRREVGHGLVSRQRLPYARPFFSCRRGESLSGGLSPRGRLGCPVRAEREQHHQGYPSGAAAHDFRDFHHSLQKLLTSAATRDVWRIRDLAQLPKCNSGRAILIGDAAHAVTPQALGYFLRSLTSAALIPAALESFDPRTHG
ncbi:hypothetical protein DFH08DRAFT_165751 [Mycena albidolilacea]|uniref:FAD-binding domain-containing protein n=1 Tax=Mycena albidolilacea TaxID=1033008 RepID=A0AAD7ARA0_9AGAR|nr:hypothetical protein DFH08DRAFT_165751 [Mycena albidolilacea]